MVENCKFAPKPEGTIEPCIWNVDPLQGSGAVSVSLRPDNVEGLLYAVVASICYNVKN